MPYPNEHALRLQDPKKFDEFRSTSGGKLFNKVDVPKSVRIIWGHPKGANKGVFVPQALRFPTKSFTADEAKKWVKDHEMKGTFEPAEAKKESLIALAEAFQSLWQELNAAIDDKFGSDYFVTDFSKDTVLMRKSSEERDKAPSEDEEFYRVGWHTADGAIEFDGDPVKVRKVVTYV